MVRVRQAGPPPNQPVLLRRQHIIQAAGRGSSYSLTTPRRRGPADRAAIVCCLNGIKPHMQSAGRGLMRCLVKIIHGGGARHTAPPSFPQTDTGITITAAGVASTPGHFVTAATPVHVFVRLHLPQGMMIICTLHKTRPRTGVRFPKRRQTQNTRHTASIPLRQDMSGSTLRPHGCMYPVTYRYFPWFVQCNHTSRRRPDQCLLPVSICGPYPIDHVTTI